MNINLKKILLLSAVLINVTYSETKLNMEDADNYKFINGYPTSETVKKAYDEADSNRALMLYKFFYPTVSIYGTWNGNIKAGLVPNKVFGLLSGMPKQLAFTPNSDTRYASIMLDLNDGPMVIEIPEGPIMGVANDLNQLYVMDLGIPGPDKGKGGKHIVVPPGYTGKIPSGYYIGKTTTNRVLVILRAIPDTGGQEAQERILKSVKIYPLNSSADKWKTKWINIEKAGEDFTPLKWENNIEFWRKLYEIIDKEPINETYKAFYGELSELGIEKGKPFNPDERMKKILEKAAKNGNDIMRVQSFADRREERIVWKDRKWEWASLRYENGTFDKENYIDLYAREKWFYQAQLESPAMFTRSANAGSLYWLGTRDKIGIYLDGGKTYKLTVPLPVPERLFWSITVYDVFTRSEIATDQNKAALRSEYELKNKEGSSIDLYFGPKAPVGKEGVWIKTIPNKGWFAYFRIYGPEPDAFNGEWKPGDFEEIK